MTLLSSLAHSRPLHRVTEDLFEVFGLTGIAAEVARTKPNGEKNALRKTYKGHIKSLGVNGHFDKVEKDAFDPDGFIAMCGFPEHDWFVHEVSGKEIDKGLNELAQSNLLRAMTMAKGPIPKEIWDSSVLGDLAPGNMAKKSKDELKKGTPGTPLTAPTGGMGSNASKLHAAQIDRTKRFGKKRSYQDSSFEGYGDGFPDDAGSGYSTTEGDERSSKLKRRKQVTTDAL